MQWRRLVLVVLVLVPLLVELVLEACLHMTWCYSQPVDESGLLEG